MGFRSITSSATPFLSTPSARRATSNWMLFSRQAMISIHALREEGDVSTVAMFFVIQYFYPRPPRGGRQRTPPRWGRQRTFLSTPSARRATYHRHYQPVRPAISIHALREEGDGAVSISSRDCFKFLSTPSARRATRRSRSPWHNPRYFYPRPPRGGRQKAVQCSGSVLVFLSTPSARRATPGGFLPVSASLFLSTPSARRATTWSWKIPWKTYISIHALREEGDTGDQLEDLMQNEFLSTPSARRATGAELTVRCK